jgi:drug/metabolite transporter (DMT)-like permease
MSLPVLVTILVSVLLSALAQIALKAGMSRPEIAQAIAEGAPATIAASIATQPFVILGLAAYGLGAVVWLFVLSRIDVSLAYPFVSLGIVVTMLLGMLVFGEVITAMRAVGAAFIIVGIVMLAWS